MKNICRSHELQRPLATENGQPDPAGCPSGLICLSCRGVPAPAQLYGCSPTAAGLMITPLISMVYKTVATTTPPFINTRVSV